MKLVQILQIARVKAEAANVGFPGDCGANLISRSSFYRSGGYSQDSWMQEILLNEATQRYRKDPGDIFGSNQHRQNSEWRALFCLRDIVFNWNSPISPPFPLTNSNYSLVIVNILIADATNFRSFWVDSLPLSVFIRGSSLRTRRIHGSQQRVR